MTSISLAFRTLVGPWLLLPALALEVANLLQRGMPWRGEGLWTVEWFAISLFIIGPLCAGGAAVDAARLSRPGNIHLVITTPRPSLAYVWAAGWTAVPLMALHAIAITVAAMIGPVTMPSVGWPLMAAGGVVQCMSILWYASMGSLIGRLLPPLVAGFVAAIAGWFLYYPLSSVTSGGPQHFDLLDMGASTVSQIGLTYNAWYLTGQALVFGVTAALVLAVRLRVRSGFPVPTAMGVLLVGAAVAVLVVGAVALPADRKKVVEVTPSYCSAGQPPVCLFAEHRRYSDVVVANVRTLTDAARRHGYDALVAERVVERGRAGTSGAEVGVFELRLADDVYTTGSMTLDQTAMNLVTPDHCDQLHSPTPPPDTYWVRLLSLTMTWLNLTGTNYEPEQFMINEHVRLLTAEEASEVVGAFARCDLAGQ
jgi:hypothetical protein